MNNKQHLKNPLETGVAWRLLLNDTCYQHYFSEAELYSIAIKKPSK